MKLTVLKEHFIKGLNNISRIASGRTTLPILNNILIEAQKNALILSATNLEIGIKSQIRAKIEEKGQITIPCSLLTNYVEFLPDGPINITTENNDIILKSKNSLTKIKGTSAEEFPIIPQVERKNFFQIKAENFKKALNKVVFTVSPTETRIEISGLLFNFNYPKFGQLTLVGTDSYRLAEDIISIEKPLTNQQLNLIIPVRTIQELIRILREDKIVEIYPSENQVLFVYDNTELVSRIISGEFPDYRQIIPKNYLTRCLVNKNELIRTIKAVSLFSKMSVNDINLKFKQQENKLIISSLNNQLGESTVEIEADIKGSDNNIVFNYRYLLDGLLNIVGEEIVLEIVNDVIPGLLKSEKDKNYLYLVMPIKNN